MGAVMVDLILIRKDGHRRRVTRHAFDAHWSRLGYEVVAEPEPPKRKRKKKEEPEDDGDAGAE